MILYFVMFTELNIVQVCFKLRIDHIDFLLKLSPLMDISNQVPTCYWGGNLSIWPIQSCLNQELFTFHSAQHHSVTTAVFDRLSIKNETEGN